MLNLEKKILTDFLKTMLIFSAKVSSIYAGVIYFLVMRNMKRLKKIKKTLAYYYNLNAN